MAADRDRVCVGAVAGPHGVRGEVRIKTFTEDPYDVAAYGPVWDEKGARSFELEIVGTTGKPDVVRARIEGVRDRDAAEGLKGTRLYVPRAALPEQDEGADEFYHADLIGLAVELDGGEAVGTVRALYDFGAGDIVEVARPDGRLEMVPFTREAVPVVDVRGGKIVVNGALGLFADDEEEKPWPGSRARGRPAAPLDDETEGGTETEDGA